MILINGVERDTIDARDRGLMYGDGVFRTLPLRNRQAVCWQRQYAKLAADCAALSLSCPERHDLENDFMRIAATEPDCAVKIVVTRGAGARGYALPSAPIPNRLVMSSPLAAHSAVRERGINVRLCQTRVILQARLAGVKHLNRLDSVLARSEWDDPDIAEGLMLDPDDNIVQGTMANVFMAERGMLVTPVLNNAGVAGVQRERVLELARTRGLAASVEVISLQRLLAASEVFLTNSLIGLWPVARIDRRAVGVGPLARTIQQWLADDEQA